MLVVFLSLSFCREKRIFKYGSYWELLFYHNSSTGQLFSTNEEALLCDSTYKYSILSKLDDSFKINGKFEFLLEYPSVPGCNRWLQSINPLNNLEGFSQKAEGYEAINISWSGMFWGGLFLSKDPQTLLDGSYQEYWWYSIGAKNSYLSPKFPGPDGTPVHVVFLWIRKIHSTSLVSPRLSRILNLLWIPYLL